MGTFTQEALEYVLDYIDQELKISNERVLALREKDVRYWKEVLQGIAKDFTISSRYALMRFVYSITTGENLGEGNCNTEFVVEGTKKKYHFNDLSIEHAKTLSRKELNEYQRVLEERALGNSADLKFNSELIKKALKIQNTKKTLLSRAEAMQLGHILGFEVQHMQWFLLRVFENGAGIKLNSSSDLIDVYGFLCKHNVQEVEKLKEDYVKVAADIPKEEIANNREQNWTVSLEGSLADKVKELEKESDQDSRGKFLEWMLEISPWLDQPSRTALQIYRDMLAYAYRVLDKNICMSDAYDLYDTLKNVCIRRDEQKNTIEALFDDTGIEIDEKKSKKLIAAILKDNKEEYTAESDSCKAYRIIKAECGNLSIENARTFHYELKEGKMVYTHTTIRIYDLINGTACIEKWDILYLLWYIYNKAYFSKVDLTVHNRYNGLCAFIDCANMILNKAGLEAFYLPHIMEQSMLISILEADCLTPGFIYDELCEAAKY